MYEDILVATDGSTETRRAVAHSIGIAERFDARLHCLYVVDERLLDLFGGETRDLVATEAEAAGRDVLASVAESAGRHGVECERAVRKGVPSEAIVDYAQTEEIALVAVGTHGVTGVSPGIIGSTAERVVRRASCPVLTVRRLRDGGEEATHGHTQFDHVVVPTDGSDAAGRAAEHALAIAERYGATVHAVYVVDTTTFGSGDAPRSTIGPLREAGERAVAEVASEAASVSVPATETVLRGVVNRELLRYVDDVDADLVAMGTRGRTGLSETFLGSVTDRVLRQSRAPVLTVR